MNGVSLALTNRIGDVDPGEAPYCCQTGTWVYQQGHQPIYKTFEPKLTLCTRKADIGEGAETEETANQNPSGLRHIPETSTNP